MLFVERVPAAPLDAFVASLWYCENEPRPLVLDRVLPNGAAQLTINLKEDETRVYQPESLTAVTSCGTVLSGVSSRYCIIDTSELECVAGVSFRPGGTLPFFRTPPDEIRDQDMALELDWGRSRVFALREQLLAARTPAAKLDVLERAMVQAWRSPSPDPAVAFALDEFSCCPQTARVAAVSHRAGLSPKRFIERFRASVGVAPKQYCRIVRFQRAVHSAARGRVDWTRIAADCGYFDQAHFIHDFRSFAGITPTGYEGARTQFANHVNFLQSEAAPRVR